MCFEESFTPYFNSSMKLPKTKNRGKEEMHVDNAVFHKNVYYMIGHLALTQNISTYTV